MGPVTGSQAPLDLVHCLSYRCMSWLPTYLLGTRIFRTWLLPPKARATRLMQFLKHVWKINKYWKIKKQGVLSLPFYASDPCSICMSRRILMRTKSLVMILGTREGRWL